MAVPHGLPEGDDVGNHALGLEPPEVAAHPAEPHLHLIGDHHSTRRTDRLAGSVQIPVREHHLAPAPRDGLGQEGPDGGARLGGLRHDSSDLGGVGRTGVRIPPGPEAATIRIRQGRQVHPVSGAFSPRPTELVVRGVHQQ